MSRHERHPNQREPSSLPIELRRAPVPPGVRDWIERQLAGSVRRIRRLPGASSTAVHGVWLDDGRRAVVRRYVWSGFVDNEPDAPPREVDVLRFAAGTGLPAPQVFVADLTGDDTGEGVPAILMSFLPGRARRVPDVGQLAAVAAEIHDVDADDLGHDYFAWYDDTMTRPPADTTRPELWERALAVWYDGRPAFDPTLIHRDFHPGNVLWTRGAASGIVDWVNGCRGPFGCDVAHCRANLIDLADVETADAFLDAYLATTGRTYHPYWEIASVLEHDPAFWNSANLHQAEPRLARALAQL